jgi:phosphoribosylamine---glycine ligase
VLYATATGRLADVKPAWHDEAALCVVLAAKGYPADYQKGTIIHDVEQAATTADTLVFHAGTARDASGNLTAVGGRVLGVVGRGDSIKTAQHLAYQAVDKINWREGFCRRDIGWRAIG